MEYFRIDLTTACVYQYIDDTDILKNSLNIKEGEKFTISDGNIALPYTPLYGECTKFDTINIFDKIVPCGWSLLNALPFDQRRILNAAEIYLFNAFHLLNSRVVDKHLFL